MQATALPVYLLAGGRSSRFGSDKARALLGGEALILAQARCLMPYAAPLQVVAREPGQYADLGLPTLADREPDRGPLGGLLTALADCRQRGHDWLLLASCDVAGVRPEQIESLLAAPRQGLLALAWKADFWEPLWALYHVDLLPAVEARLARGEGALWRLLEAVPARALSPSGPAWIQINRPIDLERAHRLLPGQDAQLGPE